MNHKAAVEWNLAMREVVADTFMTNRVTVGGLTVQVDETVYSKRKYNRGRSYPQQWVFGGVCLQTGDCFMIPAPDRSSATLISAIWQNVAPGSTSDEWQVYDSLPQYDYTHQRAVESSWAQLKRSNKAGCGTHRSIMDSYLWEFMWRRRLQPGSEKQPNKNFSYCLSCAGSESANTTYGGLETYLKEKGLHLPEFHAHCRESRPAETSGRRSVPIYYCPSGACVKIKGVFQDQTFIVRECWDRLWNQPLRHGWEGCTYFDAMMDTDAHICVCQSNDMCNSGSYCFRSLAMFAPGIFALLNAVLLP
uniref:DDE_Tnp_IS1595 domain-containing protein n=1 Tax=Trichuris muris TaxID=70415 RepID=A0A5S6QTP1_TRIMR